MRGNSDQRQWPLFITVLVIQLYHSLFPVVSPPKRCLSAGSGVSPRAMTTSEKRGVTQEELQFPMEDTGEAASGRSLILYWRRNHTTVHDQQTCSQGVPDSLVEPDHNLTWRTGCWSGNSEATDYADRKETHRMYHLPHCPDSMTVYSIEPFCSSQASPAFTGFLCIQYVKSDVHIIFGCLVSLANSGDLELNWHLYLQSQEARLSGILATWTIFSSEKARPYKRFNQQLHLPISLKSELDLLL